MIRAQQRGLDQDFSLEGVVGLHDIQSLDELIRVHREFTRTDRIDCSLIVAVLKRELGSREFTTLFSKFSSRVFEELKLKDIVSPLQKIPKRLYFFLWHLKNSHTMPLAGMLTSDALKQSLYHLARFLLLLEVFVKRTPNSLPLYENLGLTHLDLAGLAQYAPNGLFINGKQLHHTYLLRKAITCFQIAIRLEACNGKEFDTSHLDVMKLLNDPFDFKENRVFLYLNPWYFFYIASALERLNDKETFRLYLDKARLILNSLTDHQNPKVRQQGELLEAVYNSMKYGGSVRFDLDQTKLDKLRQRLTRVKKSKYGPQGRSGYSPVVEEALRTQYEAHKAFLKHGTLDAVQMAYLHGIFTLYHEVRSPVERDKLIFRLNIPPLKMNGAQPFVRGLAGRDPKVIHTAPNPRPLQIA